jgi:hypothetical protein
MLPNSSILAALLLSAVRVLAAPVKLTVTETLEASIATPAASTANAELSTESLSLSEYNVPFSDNALLSKYALPQDVIPIVLNDSVYFINATIAGGSGENEEPTPSSFTKRSNSASFAKRSPGSK